MPLDTSSGAPAPMPLILQSHILQAMPGVRLRVNPVVAPWIAAYLLAVADRYVLASKQPARRGDRLTRLRTRGEREYAQRFIDVTGILCDALLQTVDARAVDAILETMRQAEADAKTGVE